MNPFQEAMPYIKGHHFKGDYTDGNGNFCGFGALGMAVSGDANAADAVDLPTVKMMGDVAAEQFPERVKSAYMTDSVDGRFVAFNDHEDTTDEDVIALFDKLAVKWDLYR